VGGKVWKWIEVGRGMSEGGDLGRMVAEGEWDKSNA